MSNLPEVGKTSELEHGAIREDTQRTRVGCH